MNSAYAACHDHGSAQRRLLRSTDCVNLNVRRNDCATTALLKLAKQQITRESESNGIECAPNIFLQTIFNRFYSSSKTP